MGHLFNRRQFGRGRPPLRRPLDAELQRRLDGWVAHLDVDLAAAQAVLRLPVDQLPPPPAAGPYEAPVEASGGVGPVEVPAAPQRVVGAPLRGAYARRARKSGGG